MDPLKREIFSIPVYWHRKEIEADWEPVRKRAESIVEEAIAEPPTAEDEALYHYIQRVQSSEVSFAQQLFSGNFLSLVRLFIRPPIVHTFWFIIWCLRRTLVGIYLCFRPILKPLVDRLKESETGFLVVCMLRGWDDDVIPPGYLSKYKTSKETGTGAQ
jgi:hypothetical protein